MKLSHSIMRSLSSSVRRSTPKKYGYFMPAEWHDHSRTFMLWPYRTENWKQGAMPAREAVINVIKAISTFEHVIVGVSFESYASVFELIGTHPQVTIETMEYDDIWMRDTGPTYLINKKKKLGGVDWKFNCWGMSGGSLFGITYNMPYEKDSLVAQEVLGISGAEVIYKTEDFVLEGGSIHVDGEGTILTTEECLLNKNRNPHLSKDAIEEYLLEYLGAEKVIWLPKGLTADHDTNGHIDNICCFIKPATVLLAWCDDPTDKQYEISREALSILSSMTDAKGRNFTVHKIPIPPPMFYTIEDCSSLSLLGGILPARTPGERLAASYVNFYLPNGGVVAPSFGSPSDEVARKILQECFPDRIVVLVPARDILLGGGNIHCITQQQPLP